MLRRLTPRQLLLSSLELLPWLMHRMMLSLMFMLRARRALLR